jgi:hypothetical protein
MECPVCQAPAKCQWGTVYDVLCYDEKGHIISSPCDDHCRCDNGHTFVVHRRAGGEVASVDALEE